MNGETLSQQERQSVYSSHVEQLDIPEDFKFGAGVSGMQVEGDDNNSDWSDSAFGMSAETRAGGVSQRTDYGNNAGRELPQDLWNRIKSEAQDPKNYRRGKSLGWEQDGYIEDLDIAQDLGLQIVRTSIERSRIEPQEGNFDPKAILHYRKFIDDCRQRGIEPVMTLFHFANPLWFSEKGGFEAKGADVNFAEYVEKLLKALDRDIEHIIVLNEPDVYTLMGYLMGKWPPEKQNSFLAMLKARHNLIEAHKRSYDKIKARYGDRVQVSTATHLSDVDPRSDSLQDRLGASISRKMSNGLFLPQIRGDIDFIALNHYMHNIKRGLNPNSGNFQNREHQNPEHQDVEPRSDLGWFLNPESIYHVLMSLKKYGLSVMVTENGLADSQDNLRPWFLRESIYQVTRAISDGVDVRGYIHWSLVGNFELHEGWLGDFGLIGVDHKTGKRTVRKSAREYQKIIATRKV
ncbi:MAG: glycoside hydrolase family 1 protein [Patescibacteria group bacterium]